MGAVFLYKSVPASKQRQNDHSSMWLAGDPGELKGQPLPASRAETPKFAWPPLVDPNTSRELAMLKEIKPESPLTPVCRKYTVRRNA